MSHKFSGIRIWNGVTENINPEGSPIFVHKSIDEECSDFHSYFSKVLSKLSHCTFLRFTSWDSFSFPWEMIEEDDDISDEDSLYPSTDSPLYYYVNDNFIYREPQNGIQYEILQFLGFYDYNYLMKACVYFKEDWDEILIFDGTFKEFPKACEVFHNKDSKAKEEWIEQNCIGLFYNFDGLTWTFYSREYADILATKEVLSEIPSVSYREIEEFSYKELLG